MLCIFVVTASYSGSLRAFLITPAMEKVIETYEQLVNSDLTWTIVLFGEPIEEDMAKHQDPSRQKFWKEKEVVEYEDFPYERVNFTISFQFIFVAISNETIYIT